MVPSYKMMVMKDGARVAELDGITTRSLTLFGKDRRLNDVALDHPSCSSQHVALAMQMTLLWDADLARRIAALMEAAQVPAAEMSAFMERVDAFNCLCAELWQFLLDILIAEKGDVAAVWSVELQLIDLGSTNGTKLNGAVVPPMEKTTLIESDVVEVGCSQRKYVIMRAS